MVSAGSILDTYIGKKDLNPNIIPGSFRADPAYYSLGSTVDQADDDSADSLTTDHIKIPCSVFDINKSSRSMIGLVILHPT